MKRSVPAYDKAVELLARRAHFRRQLEAKLDRRGYSPEEIEETLERLTGEGLIDDRETARVFVRGRLRRGPLGRRRLMSELAARGVDRDLAREVLDADYPEDDLDLAREAARRFRGGRAAGDRAAGAPAALARRLERQGFSSRAIATILRQLADGDATHRA